MGGVLGWAASQGCMRSWCLLAQHLQRRDLLQAIPQVRSVPGTQTLSQAALPRNHWAKGVKHRELGTGPGSYSESKACTESKVLLGELGLRGLSSLHDYVGGQREMCRGGSEPACGQPFRTFPQGKR